jgi:hypothetical protein
MPCIKDLKVELLAEPWVSLFPLLKAMKEHSYTSRHSLPVGNFKYATSTPVPNVEVPTEIDKVHIVREKQFQRIYRQTSGPHARLSIETIL